MKCAPAGLHIVMHLTASSQLSQLPCFYLPAESDTPAYITDNIAQLIKNVVLTLSRSHANREKQY